MPNFLQEQFRPQALSLQLQKTCFNKSGGAINCFVLMGIRSPLSLFIQPHAVGSR